MVTAFAVELVIIAILVLVPLIATGMLPASFSAPPVIVSFPLPTVEASVKSSSGGSSGGSHSAAKQEMVVSLDPGTTRIPGPQTPGETATEPGPTCPGCNGKDLDSRKLFPTGSGPGGQGERKDKPVVVSHMEDGELINRVVPVYPSMAKITGAQGEVKLHAIISRDGRIESLTVVNGSPLLAEAAIDAVRQWRYRPYVLNGQPVEVETWITVNFRRN
ncbi:MAG TPA: energy transducer TonB [Candidatus Angelobacter sp.]|nr:energy transducer TonB [Candidatus Angelobacter sp.]